MTCARHGMPVDPITGCAGCCDDAVDALVGILPRIDRLELAVGRDRAEATRLRAAILAVDPIWPAPNGPACVFCGEGHDTETGRHHAADCVWWELEQERERAEVRR